MSQKQCSMWSWFLVHLCKMMVAGGVFVIFSKFWFFELLFGVKGQKMAKNDEKCYWRTDLRNRTSSLSFMVHLCEMIKSPGVFFFFFIFIKFLFSGFSGVKGKKWTKLTKNYVCCTLYSGTIHHMIFIYGTHV